MNISIFPSTKSEKIVIIDMNTNVVLLDYANMTFKQFGNFDQLKKYGEEIIKMAKSMEEDEK